MAENRIYFVDDEPTGDAQIKVIGVGGAGGNAVNNMIAARGSGIEFITANTDLQALNATLAPTRLQLGVRLTKVLGARDLRPDHHSRADQSRLCRCADDYD